MPESFLFISSSSLCFIASVVTGSLLFFFVLRSYNVLKKAESVISVRVGFSSNVVKTESLDYTQCVLS